MCSFLKGWAHCSSTTHLAMMLKPVLPCRCCAWLSGAHPEAHLSADESIELVLNFKVELHNDSFQLQESLTECTMLNESQVPG